MHTHSTYIVSQVDCIPQNTNRLAASVFEEGTYKKEETEVDDDDVFV
jgi:hypothetical protein